MKFYIIKTSDHDQSKGETKEFDTLEDAVIYCRETMEGAIPFKEVIVAFPYFSKESALSEEQWHTEYDYMLEMYDAYRE